MVKETSSRTPWWTFRSRSAGGNPELKHSAEQRAERSHIEQINLDVITKLKQQAGAHSQIIDLVLNEVAGAIRADEEDLQIYTAARPTSSSIRN